MALGGPNIYPSVGTWLGISREIYPASTPTLQFEPFDMRIACDYERTDDPHDDPRYLIAFGRLSDMKVIHRVLCRDCYRFILKQGTVGEPIEPGQVQAFKWDEVEVRIL